MKLTYIFLLVFCAQLKSAECNRPQIKLYVINKSADMVKIEPEHQRFVWIVPPESDQYLSVSPVVTRKKQRINLELSGNYMVNALVKWERKPKKNSGKDIIERKLNRNSQKVRYKMAGAYAVKKNTVPKNQHNHDHMVLVIENNKKPRFINAS